jgi:hypothetical protein
MWMLATANPWLAIGGLLGLAVMLGAARRSR